MILVSADGVSDEPGQQPGVACYRSMEIGEGQYCWFELDSLDLYAKNGGWGTPKKGKPE